jgi:hypothetical protein
VFDLQKEKETKSLKTKIKDPDNLPSTTINIGHKHRGNKLKNLLDPKIYPNCRV